MSEVRGDEGQMLASLVKYVVLGLLFGCGGCATTVRAHVPAVSPSGLYICGYVDPSRPLLDSDLKCAPLEVFVHELARVCEPNYGEGIQHKL